MRPGLCKMNLYGVYNDMKYTLKYDRLLPDINVVKYHGYLISLTILKMITKVTSNYLFLGLEFPQPQKGLVWDYIDIQSRMKMQVTH